MIISDRLGQALLLAELLPHLQPTLMEVTLQVVQDQFEPLQVLEPIVVQVPLDLVEVLVGQANNFQMVAELSQLLHQTQ